MWLKRGAHQRPSTANADRALIAGLSGALLILGYRRRWICDDALIFTRAVRMIVAGHGPNFIVNERAETSTSTMWQWLLAGATAVSRWDPAKLAVYGGLFLSVAGFALALDATRRLHRSGRRSRGPVLLPAGALVLLASPPVWDFATSGLETGLETFWIGAAWWLLVRASGGASNRAVLLAAFVFGLGVEVRPELAIVAGAFFAALWLLERASWRRTLLWIAVAGALPVGYEIFRAGYYGVLVPLPAITKEATSSMWGRGFAYLSNAVNPYWLWWPLAAIATLLALALAGLDPELRSSRDRIVVGTPLVCAAVSTVFVLRVGGDFMHARMLMTPLWLLVLPVLVVPLSKPAAVVTAAVAVWVAVAMSPLRQPFDGPGSKYVQNVRTLTLALTRRAHPVSGSDWDKGFSQLADPVRAELRSPARDLIYGFGTDTRVLPLDPAKPYRKVVTAAYLGLAGSIVPINAGVVDMWSLASPLGAHLTRKKPDPHSSGQQLPGHEKWLPQPWLVADWADPATPLPPATVIGTDPQAVSAARRALRCGRLADLMASARAPLTLHRFLRNLFGAFGRTSLRIPADPAKAEARFCGTRRTATPQRGR